RQKYGSWFDLEILPSKLHERNLLLSTIIREENGKLFCCGKAGSNLRNSNMPGKSRQSGSFALPIFVAARWQNIIYAGKLQS
ncbi:MAG TPA: hypothetical protein PLD62_08765, partial [Candidatus Cloacimonadota bacterium]|nr:hypothetical protein [Candidatus Cloacimonadota bacterium]